MYDLSSPESTATVITVIVLAVAQLVKEWKSLEDVQAQIASSLVGAIAGVLWYAAWYQQLVDSSNLPLVVLGGLLAVVGFALVPSGLYKFAMATANVASQGRG